MVIQTDSPLPLASTIFCFRRWTQMRLSSTLPTSRLTSGRPCSRSEAEVNSAFSRSIAGFLPTRMQPSVSSDVLPAWIRIFRNRRAPLYLIGTVGIVAPSGFQRVAEIINSIMLNVTMLQSYFVTFFVQWWRSVLLIHPSRIHREIIMRMAVSELVVEQSLGFSIEITRGFHFGWLFHPIQQKQGLRDRVVHIQTSHCNFVTM